MNDEINEKISQLNIILQLSRIALAREYACITQGL